MKRLMTTFFLLAIGMAAVFGADPKPNPDSAFGVCGHLSGDSLAPKKLALMDEIGIRWVRSDFWWSSADNDTGVLNFDEFDKLVDEAGRRGVCLLPILSQRNDKKPTRDHLEQWMKYVRATVARYHDRLRYWEVINEPNLDMMWGPELTGGDYAKLLQSAYRTIKEIDPNLIVVHGGLAGTPTGYLSDEFAAVSGDFFDVMNIHCYRGGMRTLESIEWYERDIRKIFDVLAENGVTDKPLWITETGWSSLPNFGEMYNLIVAFGLKAIFPSDAVPVCGYLRDEKYVPSLFYRDDSLTRMFPKGIEPVQISLDDLKGITPAKCGVLLLPPSEAFPSPYFDDLVEYVRQGGVLFQLGGTPFRYEVEKNADGLWTAKTTEAPSSFRERFALESLTNSSDPNAPAIAINRVPDGLRPLLDAKVAALLDGFSDTYQSTRFLSTRLFDRADSATVLLTARSESFEAPTAVILRPKGAKGAIVVSTVNELETTNVCTVEDQAIYLPQNILVARSAGAQKVFWYEFQSPERGLVDKEHHFGLTHEDLSPKPAFFAYKALIEAVGDGAADLSRRFVGRAVVVDWKRADGKRGYALWTPDGETQASVAFTGAVERAFDYLGEPVAVKKDQKSLTLSPKILYVITDGEIKLGGK